MSGTGQAKTPARRKMGARIPFCGFKDGDIAAIVAALPTGCKPGRVKLLPVLIRDWEERDLQDHIGREAAPERTKRNKRMEALAKSANSFANALANLTQVDVDALVVATARHGKTANDYHVRQKIMSDLDGQISGLAVQAELLFQIANAASQSVVKTNHRRPANVLAYLVLSDVAAIYQYVTGRKAERNISRDDGKDTGPFWDFASAIWPAVFGDGTKGLPSTVKNWAAARSKYGEKSPFIANYKLRHAPR